MQNEKQLPTWCETAAPVRHKLLGELVDAMIYSGRALMEVEMLVEKFRNAGYIKSIILPLNENNHENSI